MEARVLVEERGGEGRLHPDRNFETIACSAAGADGAEGVCRALAALELGARCELVCGASARALSVLLDDGDRAARAGLDVRATLQPGADGRIRVERLRAWLGTDGAGAAGLRVVLNGWAGPYLCRPLQMGADVAVEDVRQLVDPGLLACSGVPEGPCLAVVARTERAWGAFWDAARLADDVAVAADAPALDGRPLAAALAALSALSQRRSDTALACAHFLAAHPAVAWVSYPGLLDDAANDDARRTLEHGFGPLVTFGLAEGRGEDRAAGAGETRAEAPGVSGGCTASTLAPVPGAAPRTYALSAGLESPLDVVGALGRFLDEDAASDE